MNVTKSKHSLRIAHLFFTQRTGVVHRKAFLWKKRHLTPDISSVTQLRVCNLHSVSLIAFNQSVPRTPVRFSSIPEVVSAVWDTMHGLCVVVLRTLNPQESLGLGGLQHSIPKARELPKRSKVFLSRPFR